MRRFGFLLVLLIAPAAFGQLTPGTPVVVGSEGVFVADVNGDGLDDLIGDNTVLLNLGGAKFASPQLVIAPDVQRVIGTLDFDGDGRADLITMEVYPAYPPWFENAPKPHAGGFHLFHGLGNGQFTDAGVIPYEGWPNVGDFNGDGKDDLIMVKMPPEGRTTDVAFYRSNWDGTFTITDRKTLPEGGFNTAAQTGGDLHLAVRDFNHDGSPDLVYRAYNDMVFLTSRGDGTFDQRNRFLPRNAGGEALDVVDVDGDGNMDVVFLFGNETLRVMFGDGGGRFPRVASFEVPDVAQFGHGSWTIGKFTSAQPQIALATDAGNLLIVGLQNGALKVTNRLAIGVNGPARVYGGTFFKKGVRDLMVTGYEGASRDSRYVGIPVAASHPPAEEGAPIVSGPPQRVHAVAPRGAKTFNVAITDDCSTYKERWVLEPEGHFLNDVAPKPGRLLEVANVDGPYYFRMTPTGSGSTAPLVEGGVFTEDSSGILGQAFGVDTCGNKAVFSVNVTR